MYRIYRRGGHVQQLQRDITVRAGQQSRRFLGYVLTYVGCLGYGIGDGLSRR